MDELANFNKARWEELAQANVEFTLPFLDMTVAKARTWLEDTDLIARHVGKLAGKEVLCLAASGGQQSAVFGRVRSVRNPVGTRPAGSGAPWLHYQNGAGRHARSLLFGRQCV